MRLILFLQLVAAASEKIMTVDLTNGFTADAMMTMTTNRSSVVECFPLLNLCIVDDEAAGDYERYADAVEDAQTYTIQGSFDDDDDDGDDDGGGDGGGGVGVSATSPQPTPWGLLRILSRDVADIRQDGAGALPRDGGRGVHVYVIDTGVDYSHPDFYGRTGDGMDYVRNDRLGGSYNVDCHGHGTHCAGTILGTKYGVAKGATIHGMKALSCSGSGSNSYIFRSLNWIVQHAPKNQPSVISMSLGGPYSKALNAAVDKIVTDYHIPIIVAAGNENADARNSSPASAQHAITVGASDRRDRRSSFSNWGAALTVFAPGSNIKSAATTWGRIRTGNDDDGVLMSGTSMACPHVAGGMALFLQQRRVGHQLLAYATVGALEEPYQRGSVNRLLYVGKPQPQPQPQPQQRRPQSRLLDDDCRDNESFVDMFEHACVWYTEVPFRCFYMGRLIDAHGQSAETQCCVCRMLASLI
jgi:subtilisin family serine protease